MCPVACCCVSLDVHVSWCFKFLMVSCFLLFRVSCCFVFLVVVVVLGCLLEFVLTSCEWCGLSTPFSYISTQIYAAAHYMRIYVETK